MSDQPAASDHGARVNRGEGLDDLDRRVLEFLACHSIGLIDQIGVLLGVRDPLLTTARLDALISAGLVTRSPRLRHQVGGYQITGLGLSEVGSGLLAPRVDLRRYWHDLCVAWLWLAARDGAFGPAERVFSKREMRAADQRAAAAKPSCDVGWSPTVRAKAADASFGIRVDAAAQSSAGTLHYPDLILVSPEGRAAFELQLTAAGSQQRESVLSAYGRKASIAAVVYLVEDGAIGEIVQTVAARLGLGRLIHVQRVQIPA